MGKGIQPGSLLESIFELKEMSMIREKVPCCGAGGGVNKGFPELSLDMASNRVNEAEETRADFLISTCPFCFRNLSDTIKFKDSNLKLMDLAELILRALD